LSNSKTNRSFIIPLISNDLSLNDKFIGQLFLTIEYKCVDYYYSKCDYDFVATKPSSMQMTTSDEAQLEQNKTTNSVVMNIGVLRASRLETLVKQLAHKNGLASLSLECSDLFVKFSLSFLNRPHVNICFFIYLMSNKYN
jgi:hypothetical protein